MEVILVPAAAPNANGEQWWFVEIKGVPSTKGIRTLVVGNALPLIRAEALKVQVEDALDEYRKPKRSTRPKKPKTIWQRLSAK